MIGKLVIVTCHCHLVKAQELSQKQNQIRKERWGYPDFRISGFPDFWISGFPDFRISGFNYNVESNFYSNIFECFYL